MFVRYNPNPAGHETGDCVIRAICKALGMEWEQVYMDLTLKGLQLSMWGDTNAVWEAYLKEKAFGECNITLPYQVPESVSFSTC